MASPCSLLPCSIWFFVDISGATPVSAQGLGATEANILSSAPGVSATVSDARNDMEVWCRGSYLGDTHARRA